jgi:hypothetical protein
VKRFRTVGGKSDGRPPAGRDDGCHEWAGILIDVSGDDPFTMAPISRAFDHSRHVEVTIPSDE